MKHEKLLSNCAFNCNLRPSTLVEAVRDYPGAVVVVSHDQHFLRATGARLVEVTGDGAPGCRDFEGDVGAYKKAALRNVRRNWG